MHTRLAVSIAIFLTAATAKSTILAAKEINLPGTIAGGVDLCTLDSKSCITTPDDKETEIKILNYRDGRGEAVVQLDGKQYLAAPNQITLSYKGCDLRACSKRGRP